jgi:hypothetical protein
MHQGRKTPGPGWKKVEILRAKDNDQDQRICKSWNLVI